MYESFKGIIEYAVSEPESEEKDKIFIDYDFKEEYGRRRRHITVYKKKSKPLAQFVGTDKWSTNQNVAWRMRHSEGRALVRDLKNRPGDFQQYKPVRFRRLVNGSGASACWSIATKERADRLINISLTRESAIAAAKAEAAESSE